MTDIKLPGYYNSAQAAKKLGLAHDTIRQHIWRGTLKGKKLSGIWLISEAELKKYQKKRRGPGRPRTNK